MDKVIYIIISAAVIVSLGSTVIFMTSGTAGSIISFSDEAEETECQTKADLWSEGDNIDKKCITQIPEDKSEEAMAEAFREDIT